MKRRGHTVRIGNKCPRSLQGPKVISTALPSLFPHKISNICCKPQKFAVDSDSLTIVIDNHTSATISTRSSHFIGPITPVKGKMIKGFGEVVQVKGGGTILWKIEDVYGLVHPIKTKKALYVPDASSCMLASQQWAQQARNNHPNPDGTLCATKAQFCILYWKQERYRRTIP